MSSVTGEKAFAGDGLLSERLTSLIERMRRGDLSPVELVEAHIRRIEAVNPSLNCVVAERCEAARQEAIVAEREYASGVRTRTLLGIPFTIKEMIEVAGMPLTFGSAVRRHRRGVRDATVVGRLRQAGAIPLGVTNVPEWGMWFESYNSVYGRTNNPHNVRYSPGGSSGGEGAAVGSGASVFGIGSDIGGSVRMPAAFCGVFGHKPTTGMLPLTGHYPVYAEGQAATLSKNAPYVTLGTLTRSASDIAPLLRAAAGRDGIDPNAEAVAFLDTDSVAWRGRPVYLLRDPVIKRTARATNDTATAVDRAGRLLSERGADVREAPADIFSRAGDAWFAALQRTGGPSFSEIMTEGRGMSLEFEVLRALSGRGRYSWTALFFCIGERVGRKNERALRAALRESRGLSQHFRDLIGEEGVLVSPVHPRTAPRHNTAVFHPFDFLYTAVFNVLRVPATTAPCGLDRRGLPIAVQFASARGNDHLTVAAATVVEEASGPWRPAVVRLPDGGRRP